VETISMIGLWKVKS